MSRLYSLHRPQPQVPTRVLLSSIFFMADSVVKGYLRTAYASIFCTEAALQGPRFVSRHQFVQGSSSRRWQLDDAQASSRRLCSHLPGNLALTSHLILMYLGSRAWLRVLGRWKTTENRGLRVRLNTPFLTALAALEATALASALPAEMC